MRLVSTIGDYVRLLLVVVPFIGAPGPGNLMCAATGSRHGIRQAIPFIIGLEVMVFIPAMAVGLGVGEVLSRTGGFLDWLQVAGSLFILFLAVRLLLDPPAPVIDSDIAQRIGGRAPSFYDAVLLQALNAKGAAVLLVIFAEFADRANPVATAFRISAVVTVVSLIFHVLWLRLGQWLSQRFSSPRALRVQGWIYALMLAGVALWLLIV